MVLSSKYAVRGFRMTPGSKEPMSTHSVSEEIQEQEDVTGRLSAWQLPGYVT